MQVSVESVQTRQAPPDLGRVSRFHRQLNQRTHTARLLVFANRLRLSCAAGWGAPGRLQLTRVDEMRRGYAPPRGQYAAAVEAAVRRLAPTPTLAPCKQPLTGALVYAPSVTRR